MKNNKKLGKVAVILLAFVVIAAGILSILHLNSNNTPATDPNVKINASIVSPSGAPSLALVGLINDEAVNLEYEVVDGPDVLMSEFTSAEKDFIIAPLNLGVKLIDKGAEYKLLGVLTWGNLYLVGDGSAENGCALFGEGSVPGVVFNYVKDSIDKEYLYESYGSAQEVMQLLKSGKFHTGLLAEPLATAITADGSFSRLYNVQDLWKEKTGNASYPQAAIFVANKTLDARTDEIMAVASKIEMNIANLNSNPEGLVESAGDLDLSTLGFANVDLVTKALPNMALNFEYAYDVVDEIQSFLDLFKMQLNDLNYVQ